MSAMDEWYAKHEGRSDSPTITVWMPRSLPSGRLDTIGHGCGQPDTLADGPIYGGVQIGGIEFRGLLDDIELLFAAAVEELARIRSIADEMAAVRDATDVPT